MLFLLSSSLLPVSSERVQAVRYLQLTRQLVSCSADGGVTVWNMDTPREEVGTVCQEPGIHLNTSSPSTLLRVRVGKHSGPKK